MAEINFQIVEPTDTWQEKTLKIKSNIKNAAILREEIKAFDAFQIEDIPVITSPPKQYVPDTVREAKDEKDEETEKVFLAISKWLVPKDSEEAIKSLESIIDTSNIRFSSILSKVKLKLYKELQDFAKLYFSSKTKEEAEEVKEMMDIINLKLKYLSELKEEKDFIKGATLNNNLFFLTSNYDKVIFYDSFKRMISPDYYPQIIKLLELIKKGVFKRVKKLVDRPYFEVKFKMIRILLDKLSDGNYIIIDVFVKREEKKHYKDNLDNRDRQYLSMKSYFLASHQKESFKREHQKYFDDIISALEERKPGGLKRC